MDRDEVINAFSELRATLNAADEQVQSVLPCIAGRLRESTHAIYRLGHCADALSALKRELRNWDINKRRWVR